ncbi:serine hydrolase [Streptomyces erythrochromogenes]|uniref:serine hydrolase n=1 Tax=Streptomyces erythrochromogenes TaxID=285574 RepID=UPI00341ABA34
MHSKKYRWGISALVATVSALGIAVPASAATAPRPAPATKSVECSSSTAEGKELAAKLSKDISGALKDRKNMVSASLYDREHDLTCSLDAHKAYDSASVVKPIVLGALLMSTRDHGGLTDQQKNLARAMIVSSDNDATNTLWAQLSENGDKTKPVQVQKFLKAAGMNETVLDKEGSWGLTRITASDQARLLQAFTTKNDKNSPLTAGERAYALSLMHDVQADQRWGTPAGTPAGVDIYVKNGWLQRSLTGPENPFDQGDWKVNSMGAFQGQGRDYGLVVLTEDNQTRTIGDFNGWYYGINTIEAVAKVVHRDLNPQAAQAGTFTPQRPNPASAFGG